MKPIKILIVDDEPLIRGGLTTILETYESIQVIGNAENGQEAVEFMKQHVVDVILMDIRMPIMNGVEATKEIKQLNPSIQILILTTFNDDEYIKEAISYGASGYLLKDSDYDQIYESIKTIARGNIVMNKEVMDSILNQTTEKNQKQIQLQYQLSEQEVQIIVYIANGLSNKEIAEQIYLSEGSIKNIITTILGKLNLKNRTQLTIFAFKNNIVE